METQPNQQPSQTKINTKTHSSSQSLKKRSVFLMWLFSMITFGIYVGFWYIMRRSELDSLNTKKN